MSYPPKVPFSPTLVRAFWRRRQLPYSLVRAARRYGDAIELRGGREPIWLFSHPDLVHQAMVANPAKWSKARGVEKTKRMLGEGILGSSGELHRSRRRLIQPLFSAARLPFYAKTIVDCALDMRGSWKDGETVDMSGEMSKLALDIVASTIFGVGTIGQSEQVAEALDTSIRLFNEVMNPLGNLFERLPSFQRRLAGARADLDSVVFALIEKKERQIANGEVGDGRDALSILLRARDENGEALPQEAIRDEAMTLLLAGHETTGSTLAFAWWLMSHHPEVRAQVEAEVDAVLGERHATIDDLKELKLTRAVLSETIRLLPPAWMVARRAVEDNTITFNDRTFVVPQGTTVLVSAFVLHRDGRFWKEPRRFVPSRWVEDGFVAPKWSYLPFGAGTRACPAEHFAWMETTLVLATLVQKFRVYSDGPLELEPSFTMRSHGELMMCLEKR